MVDDNASGGDGRNPDEKRGYEPPSIVWEERYEPVGFGVSCARQEGNPGCAPGPTFT